MKKQRKYSENLTGQAGQTTSEIGNALAGPDRRRVGLESHTPGRAWARDLKISPAGPGAGGPGAVGPARLSPTSEKNKLKHTYLIRGSLYTRPPEV